MKTRRTQNNFRDKYLTYSILKEVINRTIHWKLKKIPSAIYIIKQLKTSQEGPSITLTRRSTDASGKIERSPVHTRNVDFTNTTDGTHKYIISRKLVERWYSDKNWHQFCVSFQIH